MRYLANPGFEAKIPILPLDRTVSLLAGILGGVVLVHLQGTRLREAELWGREGELQKLHVGYNG